ncbi:protein adenylyltransferase SelO [Halotalea alkalilenta]|uniref:protein adenylyltransferase SelO n=1 Tax=Halotalea alkalilenta TaxID=376489 RepID=UPI0009EEBF4C|nr:YdiU family protein [Halotalea alkalilenta]
MTEYQREHGDGAELDAGLEGFAARFDNRYARLPAHFFTRVAPTPRKGTRLLDVSPGCLALLGLDAGRPGTEAFTALLGGEQLWPGMDPIAQKYTGHQFGIYNPSLGDGRGLLLGEWLAPDGQRFDLHLKGAGVTPYSRFADGQAVLRSSLREYLASEAMAALGVPTSRALAVAVNQERVRRERWEPGATLLRVAPSHVRFGHFEWLAFGGDKPGLRKLIDHVIDDHWPHLRGHESPTAAMFDEVVAATAEMIAAWQAYGFVHGVMNTDNMSILGLTFDYGPFAFQDAFDPGFNPNHTDQEGRYSYAEQPSVGLWNLSRLASALLGPISDELGGEERARDALAGALERYGERLNLRFGERMRARLGLELEQPDDPRLLGDFLALLQAGRCDYHLCFRALADWHGDEPGERLRAALGDGAASRDWLARYRDRLGRETRAEAARMVAMNAVNPLYVLRTHLAQRAIEAIETSADTAELVRLRACLSAPFTPQPGAEAYASAPPAGAPVCLSCSS